MREYKKNDIIELTITDIGTQGEGIGRVTPEDIPFFVKGALTGDKIRAGVMKLKSSYGYARLIEVVEPSPWRTEPRCTVAGPCGGCTLQHLSYEKQAEYKQKHVQNCLERIGGLKDIPMEPIATMEEPWYYRNKAQFPVSRGKDGRVKIGFFAGHTHSVIDTTHCYIQAPVMQPLLETIREFLEEYEISTYDEETGKGLVRHILMRVGFATGEIMVCPVLNGEKLPKAEVLEARLKETVKKYNGVKSGQVDADEREAALGIEIAGDMEASGENKIKYELTSFCININKKKTNVILGDKCILLSGREYITDKLGEVSYRISPLSFYQVNPVQTKRIYDTVKEYAGLTGEEVLWDIYCGAGTIGLYLAEGVKKLYGIEIIPEAIADAKENAKTNGIENAEFYVGAAEDVFPKLMKECPPDVAVIDPPRKGCDEKLIQALLEVSPKTLVYVSCDPATLARDLKLLTAGGYEVKRVRAVDAFCHSVHVETVCLLEYIGV